MTSLIEHNTFHVEATANDVLYYHDATDIAKLLTKYPDAKILPIGSGSNILFTGHYDGLIFKSANKDIVVTEQNADSVLIRCGAAVVWDDFVCYCVEHDYQGAENLSLIPGTCGASAVQNIGAYGVEAKDLIVSVEAVNRKTRETETIEQEHINYGYRTSNFKTLWADTYVISAVTYRLKVATHITKGLLNLTYRGLNEAYDKMSASMPHATPLAVLRHAVIAIREQKLPPVQTIGSAGSFFMNPAVSTEKARLLQEKYPDMPHYDNPDGTVKIPAAWLIEQCGWKGYREGDAAVYERQPLVLVNYGKATGKQILNLSRKIQNSVREKFGIELRTEAIII